MDTSFDQHGINHATVAISLEMNRHAADAKADTLFLGGARPNAHDRNSLADFALRKNYKLIFASFDPADPGAGPIGFDAVVTDGDAQSTCLEGGRLWKRDRRTPALLLFPAIGATLKISRKGRMIVREMKGQYHDQGFDFAREAVVAQAAHQPGHAPVVAQLGALTAVLDLRTVAAALEAA